MILIIETDRKYIYKQLMLEQRLASVYNPTTLDTLMFASTLVGASICLTNNRQDNGR